MSSFGKYIVWCFTLQFLLLCVICALENSDSSSSWAKLQMSPDTLASMEYGNIRVNIYEHAKNSKSTTLANENRYFYAPIAHLEHKSATSQFNKATNETEMKFQVTMWNNHVQSEVVKFLSKIVDHEIKPFQVQIIVFEQVLLASKKKKPSTAYSLSTDWHPYQLEKYVWFSLSCFQEKDCSQLKDIMLENPSEFHHLKLLFSLSSQTSQIKESVIRIENIVSGQMANNLLQRFNKSTDPLLTANDVNKLISETTTNVMVETFDDSDVISPNSETQIYNTIKDLLVSSRTVISKLDDILWNSVFWNDDNYRPDKTSKMLNEIYRKQDTESKKSMSEIYKSTNLAKAGGEGYGFSLSTSIDLSRENSTSKEAIDKLFQESKDHVEWNGEKFVPKSMSLSRINLGNLRDSTHFQDRRVRVRYSTAILSTPIHFTQISNGTDDWIELLPPVITLRKELKELKTKYELDLQTANTTLSVAMTNCNMAQTKLKENSERWETRCVMSPHCYWEGTAPFCNPGIVCPEGFHIRCKDGGGDTGVYCWTGYKALCCRN